MRAAGQWFGWRVPPGAAPGAPSAIPRQTMTPANGSPNPYEPPSADLSQPEKNIGAIIAKVCVLLLLSVGASFLAAKRMNLGEVPAIIIGGCIFGVGLFAILKLGRAPRELWYTFALKLFSVTAYKILNSTLVLWMAADLGFAEGSTSAIITAWALTMSVATILVGSVTDAIGVRRTLFLGVAICLLTRLVMISTTNAWVALIFGLFPLAIGEALCTPVLVAALRKVTTPTQRTVAFSLFYAIMNLGFTVSWFLFDSVKAEAQPGGALAMESLSPFRVLLLASLVLEACLLPFIFLMKREVSAPVEGGETRTFLQSVKQSGKATIDVFANLLQQPGFGRLLAFLAFIGCLKVVFNAMDYVLPKFVLQELGADAKVGRFNAINGILILVLAPLVGMATRKYSAWSMVILGGFITAGSFIFMVLPPATFQSWADSPAGQWIGHEYMGVAGPVSPWIVMIVAWQVLFSIGEAFYSPRVYEYAAAIAPKGQEASYSSLSYVPLLIGKLINGAAFAFVFTTFYPSTGETNPSGLWGVIGGLVLIAPVGLLLLSRRIRVKEEGRDGGTAAA